MTQVDEQKSTQEIVSTDPGQTNDGSETFVEMGAQKVQLDIEDAPFLTDPNEAPPPAEAPAVPDKKAPKSTEDAPEEAPKNKKKLIIIAAAGLLLLIIIAGAAFVFLSAPEEDVIILQNIITVPTPPEELIPTFFQVTLDPFWVELQKKDNGAKFIIATFTLSMDTQDVHDEVTKNLKVVRDAIYYYLIHTGSDFLVHPDNVEKVRNGISEIVNQYVVNGPITDVYFDSFLMK